MTPAEEEDARRWYESISQGWLTRWKAEGANEGGINALEDIIASMDRCDVAEDPELEAVRKGLELTKEVGCTALTPITREDQALVPTGKLTSSLRPYSAKEGDEELEANAAVSKLAGRAWVSEFRKHHPAARVSPGLTLRALTGEQATDPDVDDAEILPASGSGAQASKQTQDPRAGPDDEDPDTRGREAPWWEQQEVEVSAAPSLEERAAHVAPGQKRPKAKPKERSKMAMPKARLLTASVSSQPRARSGILLNPASSSSTSAELGSDLSGLFSWS
uniref:Uncharacterized protein n=1 Tax=Alexandrium catenella TaxID=2925 RepID=A0A7S1WG45_ALECA